jgi:hypothetical protein
MPSKIQISAMNPALPNGQQRIGFWTFDQNRIANLIKETETSREIRIFVPWQSEPTPGSELIVFVRSHDSSGNVREGSGFVVIESTSSDSVNLVADAKDGPGQSKGETSRTPTSLPGSAAQSQNPSWSPLR